MVQCEMCGTETGSPITAKIEGAELQVCDSCAEFGTAVSRPDSTSTNSKYSTASTTSTTESGSRTKSSQPSTRSTGSSPSQSRDLFDEMEVLAEDYPDRIREARENLDLSQEELAEQLHEKASLIRKFERGDMQPSDQIQRKLERELDITLTEQTGRDDSEWKNDISPSTTTLGDIVKRGE